MKKWIRIPALVLVFAMSLALLCGCGGSDALVGRWTATTVDDEKETKEFLESIGMLDEEIALIDLSQMKTVQLLAFDDDKTYTLGIDAEGCEQVMREFAHSMMDDLYEGRAKLVSVYGEEVASVSKEEFNQVYAEMFGCADYQEFVEMFATQIVDFRTLEDDNEEGTYSAFLGKISFTVKGESQTEDARYTLKDGKLTVTYADMVVTYEKD